MFETVNQMRVNFYDLQATKIQALWRGYKSRKTKPEKHNFYKRKKYLQAVNLQNEIITEQLSRFKQQRDEEKYKLKAITEENNIIQEARRTHYLLSTRQIQGVYDPRNKNGQRRYPMDNMLRTVKPFSALDRLNNKKKLPNIGELKLEDLPSSSTILNNEGNIRNAKENEFNNYSKKAQLANQNKIRYEKAKKTKDWFRELVWSRKTGII